MPYETLPSSDVLPALPADNGLDFFAVVSASATVFPSTDDFQNPASYEYPYPSWFETQY